MASERRLHVRRPRPVLPHLRSRRSRRADCSGAPHMRGLHGTVPVPRLRHGSQGARGNLGRNHTRRTDPRLARTGRAAAPGAGKRRLTAAGPASSQGNTGRQIERAGSKPAETRIAAQRPQLQPEPASASRTSRSPASRSRPRCRKPWKRTCRQQRRHRARLRRDRDRARRGIHGTAERAASHRRSHSRALRRHLSWQYLPAAEALGRVRRGRKDRRVETRFSNDWLMLAKVTFSLRKLGLGAMAARSVTRAQPANALPWRTGRPPASSDAQKHSRCSQPRRTGLV